VHDGLVEIDHLTPDDDAADDGSDISAVPLPSPSTTEPAPRPPRLARCGAAVLDGAVFLVVGLALGAFTSYEEMSPTTGEVIRTVRPSIWVALGFAFVVLGGATATVRLLGGTPGMALAGVRVTRTHGGRLGFGRSLLRAVLALGWLVAPTFLFAVGSLPQVYGFGQAIAGLWFFLVVGTIVGDPHGRGNHDRLVGSVVCAVPRRRRIRG
jgi:uncharacterized RDD family membrane protein YckC